MKKKNKKELTKYVIVNIEIFKLLERKKNISPKSPLLTNPP
jgi:hypothetical protein